MSIRVATLNFTTSPFAMVGSSEPPYYTPWAVSTPFFPADIDGWIDDFRPVFEASPIYTEIEVRLRIVGGSNNGFDETVTFTREPIASVSTAQASPAGGIGICGFDTGNGFAGTLSSELACKMGVGIEVRGDSGYYSDPKKQQLIIHAIFTFGAVDVFPPFFFYDTAWPTTGTRESATKWGYGSTAGEYEDASAWSATKWRDYRGSYSAIVAAGYYAFGGTATYDWTLS